MMSATEEKKSDAEKLPDRKRVHCGNKKCNRFICEIEIHVSGLFGEVAEVFDLKCSKCGFINSFKVSVRDKKGEKTC